MIPKLSICCIAYNHARFIRQALDGFVMQKTDFPFVVLIHDDASTDGTANIIREYETKYPDIIKPIYQTENQWSKGVAINKTYNWSRIQSEYVAFCEGDDYWTDPLKLQKQVDFLDAHPDYTICFHKAKVFFDEAPENSWTYPSDEYCNGRTDFTIDDLFENNFTTTASLVYRWAIPKHFALENLPNGILPYDWYLLHLHANFGKIHMLNDIMSVYRRQPGGIWQSNFYVKYGDKHYRFFDEVNKVYNYKYNDKVKALQNFFLKRVIAESIAANDFQTLQNITNLPLQSLDFPNKIIIPAEEYNLKKKIINKISKLLGCGSVFLPSDWV